MNGIAKVRRAVMERVDALIEEEKKTTNLNELYAIANQVKGLLDAWDIVWAIEKEVERGENVSSSFKKNQ